MAPIEILREAAGRKFSTAEGALRIKLRPGLSAEKIVEFESRLPGPLPEEIRELITFASGFEFESEGGFQPFEKVGFWDELGGPGGPAYQDAFPYAIALMPDGGGNYWNVDIQPDGGWGVIFYACHDPAVCVIQAESLEQFLVQVFTPGEDGIPAKLRFVYDDAASRIWAEDPFLIPLGAARASEDPALAAFAQQLPENYKIADLRARLIGSGYAWGRARPEALVMRMESALVFAVEQPARRGVLGKLFGYG